MNERDMARKITQTLNHSLTQLDQDALARLQAARKQALAAQAKPRHAFGLAWAGTSSSHHDGHGTNWHPKFWLTLAVLLAATMFAADWQTHNTISMDASDEVDASLLAGDLPFHAYLDEGFDTWLEESSPQ